MCLNHKRKFEMKHNWDLIVGIGWICFMVGIAYNSIGQTPKNTDPFSWTIVPLVILFTVFPFLLGYSAGKFDGKSKTNNPDSL